MADVVSQLEVVIAGIETRTEHESDCLVNGYPGEYHLIRGACSCGRVRTELRNDSTPEGKKIWDDVDRCAESAPQWVKDKLRGES